jgi:hypothetical protein
MATPPPRADEQLRQVVIQDPHPLALGCVHLAQDRSFFPRHFGLPPRVGMMEAVHGRAAGQRPLTIGRDIHQRLEQRILADDLGVVAIGIAGEDLIDFLREQRFAAVGDELLGAGIGKA